MIMKSYLLIFSCIVFVVKGKLKCFNEDSEMVNCLKCIHDSSEVLMPSFSLYIIGFLMILMVAIIICLAVLLYRTRMKEYKIFPPPNQLQPVTTNLELNRSFITPTSHEMTILKMDSLAEVPPNIKQVQERHIEGSCNSLTMSSSNDLKRGTIDRHTGLGKDFKVYRSVKRTTDQHLILKEQMKKICEDALARSHINGMTASLKDLNELLQEHNNNPESVVEVKDKSSSYPELDVYDNVPSNIPVNEMAGEAVYDCLPSSQSKNIIIEDYDTKYLLPISRENHTEPAYINAQYRYN